MKYLLSLAKKYDLSRIGKVIVGGDGLRGMGAIEGNVDKVIADRMKKRGMSWTRRGADRMARLISLREMGELDAWIKCSEGYWAKLAITACPREMPPSLQGTCLWVSTWKPLFSSKLAVFVKSKRF